MKIRVVRQVESMSRLRPILQEVGPDARTSGPCEVLVIIHPTTHLAVARPLVFRRGYRYFLVVNGNDPEAVLAQTVSYTIRDPRTHHALHLGVRCEVRVIPQMEALAAEALFRSPTPEAAVNALVSRWLTEQVAGREGSVVARYPEYEDALTQSLVAQAAEIGLHLRAFIDLTPKISPRKWGPLRLSLRLANGEGRFELTLEAEVRVDPGATTLAHATSDHVHHLDEDLRRCAEDYLGSISVTQFCTALQSSVKEQLRRRLDATTSAYGRKIHGLTLVRPADPELDALVREVFSFTLTIEPPGELPISVEGSYWITGVLPDVEERYLRTRPNREKVARAVENWIRTRLSAFRYDALIQRSSEETIGWIHAGLQPWLRGELGLGFRLSLWRPLATEIHAAQQRVLRGQLAAWEQATDANRRTSATVEEVWRQGLIEEAHAARRMALEAGVSGDPGEIARAAALEQSIRDRVHAQTALPAGPFAAPGSESTHRALEAPARIQVRLLGPAPAPVAREGDTQEVPEGDSDVS